MDKSKRDSSERFNSEREIKEIRIDPVVPTESVLVSTIRNLRPRKKEQPAPRDQRTRVETCPFCVGNESMTPPAIVEYLSEDQWCIRIVENLYPVLSESTDSPVLSEGLRQAIDGYGRHEVIIDHSEHGIAIHEMTASHLQQLFSAYQKRMQELYSSDSRLRYVLVFKNFGPAAGASIAHTHSQIIALPVVPENVQAEVHFSASYFRQHHHCVFCALIDDALTFTATVYDKESGESHRQLDTGVYVVERSDHFVAIKPFASRFEWEIHILPLQHQADFMDMEESLLLDFAKVFKNAMTRLDTLLEGAQYNYFLHTLPNNSGQDYQKSYHWHLEICPRTSIPSGFELGSGLYINTVSPESAAKQLREIQI